MTPPGPAARHDGDRRNPVPVHRIGCVRRCRAAHGTRRAHRLLRPGRVGFRDVAGLPAYLDLRDIRLDFTTITDGAGSWSPRSTSTPAWRPPTRSSRCCPAPTGSR